MTLISLFFALPRRLIRYYRWLLLERPMRFTRFGTFYVLFTIAVGAAAINTGNNLLYLILGIQLSFIIVSGFLSDSVLWGLQSHWEPAQDLFAGQRARWNVRVHKGWFPAALVKVMGEWTGDAPHAVWTLWIPSHQSVTVSVDMTPRERGWIYLHHARYSTAFPFGLFEKTHTQVRHEKWLVFPRLHPVPLKQLLAQSGVGTILPHTQRAGEGTVPWHIRDYRPGDSLRRMDWKAAAKRQRWIVKETEDESDTAPVLVVRAWPTEDAELFISFIASLLWAAQETDHSLSLCTPDRYFQASGSLRPIWRYLALLDPQSVIQRAISLSDRTLIDAHELWTLYRYEIRA